ncbi:tetratricopeptide repeat protein [Sphingomonas montanisoli]|uniref:Tetratricopeptide repeat protein n=2 Tax=Sphingomonas montanisoli TaxID=2606412 RepID=A0A5D9CCS8_9SPHN|nr:tetratricopeptide repeat protein [Sphingomonas montanisoli]
MLRRFCLLRCAISESAALTMRADQELRLNRFIRNALRRWRRRRMATAMREADLARDGGNKWRAAMLYERVVERFPDAVGAMVQQGNLLKDLGDLDRAERVYQGALVSGGDEGDINLQLGHLYKLKGQQAKARQFYEHALGADPNNAHAAMELAHMRNIAAGDPSSEDLSHPAFLIFRQMEMAFAGRRA